MCTGHAFSPGATGSALMTDVWVSDDATLPVNERIKQIAYNVDRLRKEIRSLEGRHIDLSTALKKAREEDAAQAQKDKDELRQETEGLHTGSIGMTVLGLECIAIGVVLSTFGQEMAYFF